jgi:GT2 family glycosyltransferase
LKIGGLLPTNDALYDVCLKVSEQVSKVEHIDDVLFHFRNKIDKTRPSKGVVESAILRRDEPGRVEVSQQNDVSYTLHYNLKEEGKVSVIIPTKNLADVTDVCIKSIFDLTSYPNFEVILIDNNSSEDALFELVKRWEEKEPQRFKCIKDSGDFNFARLMNFGVSESTGDYILLLNNDTEVLKADWMTCLVEQAQRDSIGVVGVKLLYSNDTIQHAGVLIGYGGIAGHCFVGFQPQSDSVLNSLTSVRNYSGLTAACFMSSKEKYLSVGGFDENLAIEYNDIDFCLKLLDKGYDNVYIPHVSLYHYESISRGHPFSTRKSYNQSMKEQNYFYSKWSKYTKHDPCYNKHLSLTYDDFRLGLND